jgi:hypothetical protein
MKLNRREYSHNVKAGMGERHCDYLSVLGAGHDRPADRHVINSRVLDAPAQPRRRKATF